MTIEHPPRNLGLDLVRVTEEAALVAGRWMGRGLVEQADEAAAQAMYRALNTLDMAGTVVIGEEGKLGLHSPLDTGQPVGTGQGPEMDVVVDPIDGRKLLARGHPDAMAVAGIAPRGSMWAPRPAVYMEKIVVCREVALSRLAQLGLRRGRGLSASGHGRGAARLWQAQVRPDRDHKGRLRPDALPQLPFANRGSRAPLRGNV